MEKLLAIFKGENSKKQIENIVIFMILLIIVIIVINSMFQEQNDVEVSAQEIERLNHEEEKDALENQLQKILSRMAGVGQVEVMVSYANTILQVPMYDTRESTTTIEEQDVNGGKRKTEEVSNEQSVIFEEKNNSKIPAVKQTIMPEVVGVIVVAEGAENSVVKENIKNAVSAVVNLPSHRIQVFSR